MQFALPDGYNLNVEEVGSGFPLIVLHGGPGLDHSMFRPYLDPLGDEYRLLYVDERGQGRSQRVDPATLSLEVFARDVDLLAETPFYIPATGSAARPRRTPVAAAATAPCSTPAGTRRWPGARPP